MAKPYTITKKKASSSTSKTTENLAKPSPLQSPAAVRKAVSDKRSSSGTIVKSSTTYYTSTKHPKEDKSLKVTVAISAKGKDVLKTSTLAKKSPTSTKNSQRNKTFVSYIENTPKTSSPSTIVKLARKTSAENAVRKSKNKRKTAPSPAPTPVTQNSVTRSAPERVDDSATAPHPKTVVYKRKIKSEPSLATMQIYLQQKKPVSDSKFRILEKQVPSSSQTSCYDRTLGFWERLDRSEPKAAQFWQGRSSSEPPPLNDKENEEPRVSSPSNRKIRGNRSPLKTIESIHGVRKKLQPPSRSTSSLNMSPINDHADYQMYVLELMHSTQKSRRFKELKSFYSSLERKGHLEKAVCNYELRPRLKGEEVIDYERWKELRKKEKAEEELQGLYRKLQFDQKHRNLLYSPNDIDQLKWTRERDRSLRIREKSVEDLRQIFQEETPKRQSRLEASRDVYKPLWRGWSVQDVANSYRHVTASERGRPIMEIKRSLSESARPIKHRGIWSSLSVEQLNALKSQLNEIYSTVSTLKRERIQQMLKKHEIAVDQIPRTDLHVRCNSMITKEQLYSPAKRQRLKSDSIASLPHLKDEAKGFSEVEKRNISKRLSHELMERMKQGKRKKHDLVIPRETLGAVAALKGKYKSSAVSRELNTSPRTCYSLDMSDEEMTRDEKNDLLLVLQPPKHGSSDTESLSSTASTVIHLGGTKRKREDKTDNLFRSSSVSDLKEIFGEHGDRYKEVCSPRPTKVCYRSSESSLYSRSRSVSPDPTKYYRAYLRMVKRGEVRKLRQKFESLEDLRTNVLRRYNQRCKRYRSDPELTRLMLAQQRPNGGASKTVVKGHEHGDVRYLKDRYERRYGTRRHYSRSVSPIHKVPFRLEDRLMPHINVISKQADLLQLRSPSPGSAGAGARGEVDRLRRHFEYRNRMSLIGQMYTSSPDFRELRNISPYLECEWIAHQYPQPVRAQSVSPTRSHCSAARSPRPYDAFANQRFDPAQHRPAHRYEPPSHEFHAGFRDSRVPSAVKFKGSICEFAEAIFEIIIMWLFVYCVVV